MLGLNRGEVRLAKPTPEWYELYQREEMLLQNLIGEHVISIQHFGSTAINHIEAKPIIDILVGVEHLEDVEAFDKEALKRHDYYHLPRVAIKGKVVFAKFSDLENLTKTHILHVVAYNGNWWQAHISFRDYLNANPDTAKEYEALKKKLASDYQDNERLYTDEKKKFVDHVLHNLNT